MGGMAKAQAQDRPPTPIATPRRSYGWCLEVRGKLGAPKGRRVTPGPARAPASFYPLRNELQPLFKKFPTLIEKENPATSKGTPQGQ